MTALYSAILADVIAITNRPELVTEHALAIRTATRAAHFGNTYFLDAVELDYTLPGGPAYTAQLNKTTIGAARLRALNMIQLIDATSVVVYKPEIEVVELGDILDVEYRTIKNNIAYIAGGVINIRSSLAASGFRLTYFQSPNVTEATYDSWIANLAPDIIIYAAAANVSMMTGNAEKAKLLNKYAFEDLREQLDENFLTSKQR